MLNRLLLKNISGAQLVGYALSALVGLCVIMTAAQFYRDVKPFISPSDHETNALGTTDFIVISKPVSLLNTLGLGVTSPDFSADEIDRLKSQPWVKGVGEFSAARFNVAAAVEFGNQRMSTYLFLEAVPDEFIDIIPDSWSFEEENWQNTVVPVILSKDYLALYNFGFATTRHLPQLSEATISQVPINLFLSGNGHYERFSARIAGFSSRLNTIAVPKSFMDWANERYAAETEAPNPSRLIVKVGNPGDPAIKQYLDNQGYEVAGDKADSGKMVYFLNILMGVVVAIGLIITILALAILILSLHLLIQKNHRKLSDLMLLGYSPLDVSKPYICVIATINISVLALASVLVGVCRRFWTTPLTALDMSLSPLGSTLTATILFGVAIMLTVSLFATINVIRSARKIFLNK